MEKGKIQGQHEIIMDIVQERFPQISALVSKQVQKIEDPIQLRRLSVKLSTAQTVQEAEQALSSSTSNGQQH